MVNKITTVSKLEIGQRFQWVPNRWFGAGKLIEKTRREHYEWIPYRGPKKTYIYDLKYDAAVVNPPAGDYGVLGSTKVKLIDKKG